MVRIRGKDRILRKNILKDYYYTLVILFISLILLYLVKYVYTKLDNNNGVIRNVKWY